MSFPARLENKAPFLLGLLLVYVFLRALAEASSISLSGDEIFTLTLARQPNVSALWTALARGADGQPPLFYLIERLCASVFANPHVGLRIPAVIGVSGTLACVYAFVKRYASRGTALICAIALLNTSLYLTYSVQARPYGMVVACVAFAMVCYQRAAHPLWTWLLFVSLALAVSLHYYAVFAIGAFGVAEAAYYWAERKIRYGLWLALILGPLPIVAFWPLLSAQRQMFSQHFWARPKLSITLATYGSFLHLPTFAALALVTVLAWVLLAGEKWPYVLPSDAQPLAGARFHERVLVLAMMAMPFAVFAAARIAHGAFLDRYVLWTTVAIAIALSPLLSRMSGWGYAAMAAFILMATFGQEAFSLYSLPGRLGKVGSPAAPLESLLSKSGNVDLPVAVWANYFVIAHYASPETANRLVAVSDSDAALQFIGTDTVDKLYSAMTGYGSFHIREFRSFAASHPAFLFYSAPLNSAEGTTVFYDWWVPKLLKDGYSLQLMAAEGNDRMYLVRAPEAHQTPVVP